MENHSFHPVTLTVTSVITWTGQRGNRGPMKLYRIYQGLSAGINICGKIVTVVITDSICTDTLPARHFFLVLYFVFTLCWKLKGCKAKRKINVQREGKSSKRQQEKLHDATVTLNDLTFTISPYFVSSLPFPLSVIPPSLVFPRTLRVVIRVNEQVGPIRCITRMHFKETFTVSFSTQIAIQTCYWQNYLTLNLKLQPFIFLYEQQNDTLIDWSFLSATLQRMVCFNACQVGLNKL